MTPAPLHPGAAPRVIEICVNVTDLNHVLTDVLELPSPGFGNSTSADIDALNLHQWAAVYTEALSTMTSPATLT